MLLETLVTLLFILTVVVLLFEVIAIFKHTQLKTIVEAASDPQRLLHLFRKYGGLPSFLTDPQSAETSGLQWLNAALSVIWSPYAERAFSKWAFTDNALERLMNYQTFWRPSWMLNTNVILQSVILGQIPPTVTEIKVLQPRVAPAKELVLDVDFEWSSKIQVQMQMVSAGVSKRSVVDRVLGFVYRAVALKVLVRDVIVRGSLRCTVRPLLDTVPVVGAITCSFLEPPFFSYQVSSFGANPLMVPGLEAWLQAFIRNQVLQPFTFPEGLTLNVAQLFGLVLPPEALAQRPEGVLMVKVVSAKNVPRMDLFGLCDPYVKAFLTDRMKQRTSVQSSTLSPDWHNEDPLTYIVHSTAHQRLTLQLWDSDVFRPDDHIGTVVVPLHEVMEGLQPAGKVLSLELELQREGGKKRYGKQQQQQQVYSGTGSGSREVVGEDIVRSSSGGGFGDETLSSSQTRSGEVSIERLDQPLGHTQQLSDDNVYHVQDTATTTNSGTTTTTTTADTANERREEAQSPILDAVKKWASPKTRNPIVNVELQFFPLSLIEGGGGGDDNQAVPLSSEISCGSGNTIGSSSMDINCLRNVMQGGMLYVHLTRAYDLKSSRGSVTRRFKVKVHVGSPTHHNQQFKYNQTAERSRLRNRQWMQATDPVFDETVDFFIDGDTANNTHTVIKAEVWVIRTLRPPLFKGAVAIPLSRVVGSGRVRDVFVLEGVGTGRLEMEIEWLSAMSTQ